MKLRTATDSDKSALIELINDAFQITDYFKYEKRINEKEMDQYFVNGSFELLEDGNQLAACVYYTIHQGTLNFSLLSVAPAFQGKGFSKVMVKHIEKIAVSSNCKAIQIEVVNIRTTLFPFYEKWGYVATGTMPFRKPTRFPCYLVIMMKKISDREMFGSFT
jgi:GNAT superfamily N-acetyltransferase